MYVIGWGSILDRDCGGLAGLTAVVVFDSSWMLITDLMLKACVSLNSVV